MQNFKLRSISFIELIYLLIPLALVFSKVLSELLMLLIISFFIFYSFKNKIYLYLKNKLFIIFIIFCLYLILNSFFRYQEVPISVLFFFRFGLFATASWFLLDYKKNLSKYILISVFITSSFVIIDAYFQYFFGFNLLGYEYHDKSSRLSGFFDQELILGSYIARFSPLYLLQLLFLYYSIKKKNNLKIILFSIALIIYSYIIFLTGERVAFSYYIITIFLFLIFFNSKKINLLVGFILFFSMTLLYFSDDSRLIKTTSLQIKQSFIYDEEYGYKIKNIEEIPIEHLKHWKTTILMVKQNPIFGIGPRMFREKCDDEKYIVKGGCATHPHNLYFQLLGEAGILGFISLILLFIYILNTLIRNLKKRKSIEISNKNLMIYVSSACIFLHFFPFLPNGNFFNNWINITTFFTIGIFLHFNSKKNND